MKKNYPTAHMQTELDGKLVILLPQGRAIKKGNTTLPAYTSLGLRTVMLPRNTKKSRP